MRFHILGLMILLALGLCSGAAEAGPRGAGYVDESGFIPVYPPYPYRSGYYPKADWYYDLPPYAAIKPSFYRKRYFMMARERNRYRYVPHIFRGYSADFELDYGGDVDFNYKSQDLMNGDNKSPAMTNGDKPKP